MRLVSYGPAGAEEPGVLDPDGGIVPLRPVLQRMGRRGRDLPAVLAEWDDLADRVADAMAAGDAAAIPAATVRIGAPIPRPGKVIAIGFNYPQHSGGILGEAVPDGDPVVFLKPADAVCGPTDAIIKPPETAALDYELELGVVIGRPGHRIAAADAIRHVAGYVMTNDVSARDVSLGAGPEHPLRMQIARGKGFPTFCPMGPWLLTADEVADVAGLRLTLAVNGEPRQDGRVSEMAVPIPRLIEWVSSGMPLNAGDVILTGTPSGCGFQFDPPRYLNAGDVVRGRITGLGRMENPVVDEVIR